MTDGYVPTQKARSTNDNMMVFPPRVDDIVNGWTLDAVPMQPYPFCFTRHKFRTYDTQAPIIRDDGSERPRPEFTKVICLGSPPGFLKPGETPELSPEGVKKCESIKLPDDRSLHDTSIETDNFENTIEWRMSMVIYDLNQKAYRVVYVDAVDAFGKALFGAHANIAGEGSVGKQAIRIEGKMNGQKKAYTTNTAEMSQKIEPDEQDEEYQRAARIAKPNLDPEYVVGKCGIEKWNPEYAGEGQQAPQQSQQSGPDNPFADDSDDADESQQTQQPQQAEEDPFADTDDSDTGDVSRLDEGGGDEENPFADNSGGDDGEVI